MYLLVTATECHDLLELSYACSSCSLKNGGPWFDQVRWEEGVKKILGEEVFSQMPKQGKIDILVYRSGPPPVRLCEKPPSDPVTDFTMNMMKNLSLLEPNDFFKELAGMWP